MDKGEMSVELFGKVFSYDDFRENHIMKKKRRNMALNVMTALIVLGMIALVIVMEVRP